MFDSLGLNSTVGS